MAAATAGNHVTLVVAITAWALLAGGFWAADAIAQLKADLTRERNTKK